MRRLQLERGATLCPMGRQRMRAGTKRERCADGQGFCCHRRELYPAGRVRAHGVLPAISVDAPSARSIGNLLTGAKDLEAIHNHLTEPRLATFLLLSACFGKYKIDADRLILLG